jgi:pantothenate kinase-related protein Tda10
MPHAGIEIIIRGPHDSGRTTIASLIKDYLEQNEYRYVRVIDTLPLSHEEKSPFHERFARNRERAVVIKIELVP